MPRRKARDKVGRPTKFTVHRAVAVACALNSGSSLESVARMGEISSATIYRWLARALAGETPCSVLLKVVSPRHEKGRFWSRLWDKWYSLKSRSEPYPECFENLFHCEQRIEQRIASAKPKSQVSTRSKPDPGVTYPLRSL